MSIETQTPSEEVSLEQAGREAQEMSDAGAAARMEHAVNTQGAVFEEAKANAKVPLKSAAEIAGISAGLIGLGVAGSVGIDGFLDHRDAVNEQHQQQIEEWQHEANFENGPQPTEENLESDPMNPAPSPAAPNQIPSPTQGPSIQLPTLESPKTH